MCALIIQLGAVLSDPSEFPFTPDLGKKTERPRLEAVLRYYVMANMFYAAIWQVFPSVSCSAPPHPTLYMDHLALLLFVLSLS